MQKLSVGSNKPNYTAGPVPKKSDEFAIADPVAQFAASQPLTDPATQTTQTSRIPSRMASDQKGPSAMKSSKKSMTMLSYVVIGVAIGAGVFTGLGAVRLSTKAGTNPLTGAGPEPISQVAGENIKNGDVFGASEESASQDEATGYLEIGGIDGEGTHKLLREGGPSQTVYLTSSVTDLNKFDGMTLKVWGDTIKAQKAGWLMDVVRVEVINTQGTSPATE